MASGSITYWTRLEPRPRSASVARALRAEVRDPAWFLARQWQFGEFQGADSGSPAYIELKTQTAQLSHWRPTGSTTNIPLVSGEPLDVPLLAETVDGTDVSLQLELAQTLEAQLREAGVPESVIALYAAPYPIRSATPDDDAETARFLTAVAGRGWDGVAFYLTAALLGTSPPEPAIPSEWQGAVEDVVVEFLAWVARTYGAISTLEPIPDPPTWLRGRLRYSAEVLAPATVSAATLFAVDPGPHGELDWYSFVENGEQALSATPPLSSTRYVLPANVRFRGMPNARFWDFENAQTDFAALEVDRRDLARMLMTEFALTQSNDWFSIPVPMVPGSIASVDWLVVRDVFGELTLIRRANDDPAAAGSGGWSAFAPTRIDGTRSPHFPFPDVASSVVEGKPIEDVRLVRDELANMCWAIERIVANGLGEGRSRRDLENEHADGRGPPASSDTTSPVRYAIQNEIPREWIPLIPVALAGTAQIELQRGTMLDTSSGVPSPVSAKSAIVGGTALRVREEEIGRSGTRIARTHRQIRTAKGDGVLVLSRRRITGVGDGSSGLLFDVAAEARRG